METIFKRTEAFAAFIAPAEDRPALWRVVLTCGLTFGMLVLVGVMLGGVLIALGMDENAIMGAEILTSRFGALVLLSTFILWWIALAIGLLVFHKRGLRSLFGADLRLGLRRFAAGTAIAMGFGAFSAALGAALTGMPQPSGLGLGEWALGAALAIPLIIIQTGAEEALFRGYLQQQLAVRFRSPLVWAILPSVLFGLLHWNPDAPGSIAVVVSITALSGLILAIVTARTGGLGLAWGLHFGVNLMVFVFIAPRDYLSGVALMHWVPDATVMSRLVWLDLTMIIAVFIALCVWLHRQRP